MYGTANPSVTVQSQTAQVAGKKMLIVGGTGGIGQALAKLAASSGADVTVVGRTFRDEGTQNISFKKCDLSLMTDAQKLAHELPVSSYDFVAFTNGIVPGNTRVATKEGVEMDMAASALSRFVMLQVMENQLKPQCRIFNWGFPGAAGTMPKTTLDDFNSEKNYKGGFEGPHMNTVALNEAIVLHYAGKGKEIYGCNPGLIKSNIRDSLHGGGFLGGIMEGLINWFNPSADQYAARMLPLFTAPELTAHKGTMFGQKGTAILTSKEFTTDTTLASKWIAAAESLAKKALTTSSTSNKE